MTLVVAYRHAAYDTPWWVMPSTRAGRFNRPFEAEATQYLSLHPLGPTAERLRHGMTGPDPVRADEVLLNLWAVLVDEVDVESITFDNCTSYGINPEELVGDNYQPTQHLAARLRARGAAGLSAPSAALPGTENLVLFGARVAHPYLELPAIPEECRTGHVTDGARPAREVLPLVRWRGTTHAALEDWKVTGLYRPLDDPLAVRF